MNRFVDRTGSWWWGLCHGPILGCRCSAGGPSTASAAAAAVGVWTRRDSVLVYGEGHVRSQLAGRRWAAPLPHVVVQANGPLSSEQKMWIALLAAPPGPLLHGLSAAVVDGLRGFSPDGLTLVIPGGSSNPGSTARCRPMMRSGVP